MHVQLLIMKVMKNPLLPLLIVSCFQLGWAQDKKPARTVPVSMEIVSGGYFDNHISPPVMQPAEFRAALATIQGRAFDDDKRRVAEQVASGGRLCSEHVLRILEVFAFESTRLSFAKFAYTSVVDPQNYWLVNDGFRFGSSVSALQSHIEMLGVQAYSHPSDGSHGINHGAAPYPETCGSGSVGVNSFGCAPAPDYLLECDLDRILCSMRNQSFDSEKLRVAKQAVGRQLIGTYAVRRVMAELTFDDSRLAFAKFAYGKCYDPENYYLVNDAFTFSSSVRELDLYIRRHC
jgi:hypothetical protein